MWDDSSRLIIPTFFNRKCTKGHDVWHLLAPVSWDRHEGLYILLVYLEQRGEKVKFINQYSAVWMAAVLLVIAGIFLLRRKPKWPRLLAFGLLVTALFSAWVVLHPIQASQANDPAKIQASIGQGTPVLLEFQSPY